MDIDFAFICDYAEASAKLSALGIGFDRLENITYIWPVLRTRRFDGFNIDTLHNIDV